MDPQLIEGDDDLIISEYFLRGYKYKTIVNMLREYQAKWSDKHNFLKVHLHWKKLTSA